MPNLSFYATGSDVGSLFDYVFDRSGCRVYEASSAFDCELREFTASADVAAAVTAGCTQVGLVIPGAAALTSIRRIELRPETNARFRYRFDGWGVIWLTFYPARPGQLAAANANHFSAKGAAKWDAAQDGRPAADRWDFEAVAKASAALNRFVRKSAVGVLAARPVLPDAHAGFLAGVDPADTFARDAIADYRAAADRPRTAAKP